MEIMLNSPLIQDLIFKGKVQEIKEVMSRSNRIGMKTFDQALYELYEPGFISYEDALRNADSKNELRLQDQAREQARGQESRRRRRTHHRRRRTNRAGRSRRPSMAPNSKKPGRICQQ